MKTVMVKYKAKQDNLFGCRIQVTNKELSIDVSEMIVWLIQHEDYAISLLPEYKKIKQKEEARDEVPHLL